MVIYPAIDIRGGKCVRLVQGKFDDMTVYSDQPLEMAKKWQAAGAQFIHLVDLDGALEGRSMNFDVIGEIARAVDVPVHLGGGIRTMDNVRDMLQNGVSRVILGTAAVKNPDFVKQAVEMYGEKIVV
ncbi:MAG: tRNA-dihydrouridine synthase, partial [Hyphomonadaceae bacterium]|nr:tRNA-dihydrouridine synthase [Clostridia bacterium]